MKGLPTTDASVSIQPVLHSGPDEWNMRKPPESYYSLFRAAHERTVSLLNAGLRPGLLDGASGHKQTSALHKGPEPSPNERFWLDWFQEFTEIDSSIRRLNQALVYLSYHPNSRTFRFHGLSEADWLRYHIEAYLQETYILVERLRRFLRKVEKVTIDACDRRGLSLVKTMLEAWKDSFKMLVTTRARHVHEYRFESDELRDLDTLVLVTKNGRLRGLRLMRRVQYFKTLRKWRGQLRKNNKETLDLCAATLEETTKILLRHEPGRGSVCRT